MREERLEAIKKTDAKRVEFMKEMDRSGKIDEKRVLLNLMERKPLPKPTPLKGKSLEVIKETLPWRKGAVTEKKGGMGDDAMYVKAKARPRPKEVEKGKYEATETGEAEENSHAE